MELFEAISPLYTVYYYTDFLYRIVKFKRRSHVPPHHNDIREPQDRFDQSYCRSRSMVLQYGLCNSWDYFITITVSPKKFDRWDLDSIYKYLSQWFRDYRKQFGANLSYLLVPQHHEDGAWHFHGFVSGVIPSHLSEFIPGIHPQKLIDRGYLNWQRLGSAVGFVSLGAVGDPVAAAFYIVRYITREHAHDDFYQHLYYHSQGLKKAKPVADCYCPNADLDSFLRHESDFCFTGWAEASSFTFPFSIAGCEPRLFEELTPVDEAALVPEDSNDIFVQLRMDDWLSVCNDS